MNSVVSPNPRRRRLWRTILWPLLGLCAIFIVAWMMLPNLDGPQRRQFVNEAVSVDKLRTINRLQARYSEAHPKEGFACELSLLKSADQAKAPHYDPEEFLVTGTQSGYRFVVVTCHPGVPGVVAHYQVAALPIEPGRSGSRAFCTDESGLLWYDQDGSIANCLALRHSLE
jgi:hypothetical protein